MFTLQILDNILSILSNTSKDKIYFKSIEYELYQNILFKKQLTDLIIKKSIEKLVSEKYISEINSVVFNELLNKKINETTYEITFEGQFYISQGGYLGKYYKEKAEKERVINLEKEQLANAHKINELQKGQLSVTKILAWLTGVASVYYLIEIVKFVNSFCHFWDVKK